VFSPDHRFFLTGGEEGRIRWHDSVTGKVVLIEPTSVKYLTGLALSRDGRTLALSDYYGNIQIVLTASGETRWQRQLKGAEGIALAPQGDTLVAVSYDGKLHCLDADNGRPLWQAQAGKSRLRSVRYAPDGRTFATGSCDGPVQIWDARTGKELRSLPGQSGV